MKYILIVLFILLFAGNISGTCENLIIEVDNTGYACTEELYFYTFDYSNNHCMLWCYEKSQAGGCDHLEERFIDATVYVGDTFIIYGSEFEYYFSDKIIKLVDIEEGYIEIRICDYDIEPTPSPTSPLPGTPLNDTYFDTNTSYGEDTGTGGAGGYGEIYDNIGEGLGDGSTGMSGMTGGLFNSLIPLIFVICMSIFIAKVSGVFNK